MRTLLVAISYSSFRVFFLTLRLRATSKSFRKTSSGGFLDEDEHDFALCSPIAAITLYLLSGLWIHDDIAAVWSS